MSDIERMFGWDPLKPSCFSCHWYSPNEEHGDYGNLLSADPWCLSFDESFEDLPYGSPQDNAPAECIETGRFSLDFYYAFWQSPFCESLDGSDECTKKAFDGFIWWMENIKAVGL